jgi:D-alanine-D-alanine ligase
LADAAKPAGRFTAEDLDSVQRLKTALSELPGRRFRYLSDHGRLLDDLLAELPRRVLNFCDTGLRNVATRELHVPALLELLEIPYSGAGPACLGSCHDKSLVRAVAATQGVPVPAELQLPARGRGDEPEPDRFPVLVKPNTGDGSEGISADSLARDAHELREVLERRRRSFPDRDLLVQEFLPGRELAVGLIGNPADGFRVLCPLEVDYSGLDPNLPRILSYESKTIPQSPYWTDIRYRKADLETGLQTRLVAWAVRLFERLGCRDYARFDFREDADGRPRLLEVNPNPAWCWDGKMNLMAGFEGASYRSFLEWILEAFERRVG